MKINCPHCGVQGSVDDSLARKKLRCPECNKVFLVAEELLSEIIDNDIITEINEETVPEAEEVVTESEELEELEASEETETAFVDDAPEMEECSVCKQSFAAELMVEIDSKFHCALCQPEFEEEEQDLFFEEDGAEEDPDELPAAMESESVVDSNIDLMDEVTEEDTIGENDGISALMDDETIQDEKKDFGFVVCAGCGEEFHPDFMDLVDSKYYCALCDPEDGGEEEKINGDLEDDASYWELDEVSEEEKADSLAQSLMGQAGSIDEEEQNGSEMEHCADCGDEFHRDFLQEVDSKLYCGVCQPKAIEALTDDAEETESETEETECIGDTDFGVVGLIKEVWQETKGKKRTIWAAMAVMLLIVCTVTFGGMAASQVFVGGGNPMVVAGVSLGSQLISNWLSMLMTGGIMLIGVRSVLGQRVSWKMVFAGFSSWLSMTIAIILQTILVVIGFMLLVLPGIYLSIGYALTLPLILDKGMGPWEALEASRKAIHKKWWTVFGLYIVLGLLAVIAMIPAGIGLIWVVPMYFVFIGVLYVRLFGVYEDVARELSEEIEVETEKALEEEQEESPEENKESNKE